MVARGRSRIIQRTDLEYTEYGGVEYESQNQEYHNLSIKQSLSDWKRLYALLLFDMFGAIPMIDLWPTMNKKNNKKNLIKDSSKHFVFCWVESALSFATDFMHLNLDILI